MGGIPHQHMLGRTEQGLLRDLSAAAENAGIHVHTSVAEASAGVQGTMREGYATLTGNTTRAIESIDLNAARLSEVVTSNSTLVNNTIQTAASNATRTIETVSHDARQTMADASNAFTNASRDMRKAVDRVAEEGGAAAARFAGVGEQALKVAKPVARAATAGLVISAASTAVSTGCNLVNLPLQRESARLDNAIRLETIKKARTDHHFTFGHAGAQMYFDHIKSTVLQHETSNMMLAVWGGDSIFLNTLRAAFQAHNELRQHVGNQEMVTCTSLGGLFEEIDRRLEVRRIKCLVFCVTIASVLNKMGVELLPPIELPRYALQHCIFYGFLSEDKARIAFSVSSTLLKDNRKMTLLDMMKPGNNDVNRQHIRDTFKDMAFWGHGSELQGTYLPSYLGRICNLLSWKTAGGGVAAGAEIGTAKCCGVGLVKLATGSCVASVAVVAGSAAATAYFGANGVVHLRDRSTIYFVNQQLELLDEVRRKSWLSL